MLVCTFSSFSFALISNLFLFSFFFNPLLFYLLLFEKKNRFVLVHFDFEQKSLSVQFVFCFNFSPKSPSSPSTLNSVVPKLFCSSFSLGSVVLCFLLKFPNIPTFNKQRRASGSIRDAAEDIISKGQVSIWTKRTNTVSISWQVPQCWDL